MTFAGAGRDRFAAFAETMMPSPPFKEAASGLLAPNASPPIETFRRVRGETERRAAPLSAEDQAIQSMPDASPIKWHRAHTTWFFETFLVQPNVPRLHGSRRALRVPVQLVLRRRRSAPCAAEARADHAAECRRGRGVPRACRCGR